MTRTVVDAAHNVIVYRQAVVEAWQLPMHALTLPIEQDRDAYRRYAEDVRQRAERARERARVAQGR